MHCKLPIFNYIHISSGIQHSATVCKIKKQYSGAQKSNNLNIWDMKFYTTKKKKKYFQIK